MHACMPQVSGLSKPDIIIQIEGIEDIWWVLLIIIIIMVCCITVNEVPFNHVKCMVKTFTIQF